MYSIVIPIYNEEAVVAELYRRLKAVIDSFDEPAEVIFVDDGSADGTFQQLSGLAAADKRVKVLRFSRNFGHQIAISAGIDPSLLAALVSADADPGLARWIAPGECENSIGYWHLPGVRLVYRDAGTVRSFAVASLISWRGAWYVVHLGPNPRPSNVGTVDQPADGAGTPGPGGGC